MAKHWLGGPPETCDICTKPIVHSFIDGKTTSGPWALMCEHCHKAHGVGLGLGRGQRYVLHLGTNKFMKSEG